MAVPDLLDNGSITQNILVAARLAVGVNDFTVPAGRAWAIRSFVLCNTSTSAVTVNVAVVPAAGTARTVVSGYDLAADETLIFDPTLVAMLPEAAVLRVTSGTADAVDVVVTGVVAA